LEYDKTLFLEAHLHYDKYNTEEFQTWTQQYMNYLDAQSMEK
jgi:hypothetical protein